MTDAQLTITFPEGSWIEAVSRHHPDARVRVLAVMPAETADPSVDTASGLLEIVADDPRPIIDTMEAQPGIRRLDPLEISDGRALLQFEPSEPLVYSITNSGLPLDLPLEVQNGTTTLQLAAARGGLAELADQLDAFGLTYQVDRIGDSGEDRMLTDRQRELIRTALALGYYDTPRRASMTDIAVRLDIAKSTCSETLHRAEEKIIKHYAEERLPDQSVPAAE